MGGRTTEGTFSETGVWNVANIYSEDMIFFHALWSDRSRMMARLGCLDPIEDAGLDEGVKLNYKVTGLKWFYMHLDLLISNSKFAIKDAKLNKNIEKLHDKLCKVHVCMKAIETKKINQKDHNDTIEVNEKLFDSCYDEMVIIFETLLPILYKENLIYQYIKKYDVKERKTLALERAIQEG